MKQAFFILLFGMLCISMQRNTRLKHTATPNKTALKAEAALKYCKGHNYNTKYCYLVDMSIHSGKNRFFIWDFKTKSISDSGLVSHGCCDNIWSLDESKEDPVFSNVPEAHWSSLGKYKIGKRGYSSWGINVNYKLHGLDKTNNNAYKRIIVLHSWDAVSDEEVYPAGTPEGWGCPAVSNSKMEKIDEMLQKSDHPVLLWIYK